MPTVEREGPEPLAIDRVAFKRALVCAICDGAFGKHHEAADAFMAGPLAPILAQADTAAQAVADRDEARAKQAVPLTEEQLEARRNRAHAAIVRGLQVEVAHLSAKVEALRGALASTMDAADDLAGVCVAKGDNKAAGALQFVSGFIADRLAEIASAARHGRPARHALSVPSTDAPAAAREGAE